MAKNAGGARNEVYETPGGIQHNAASLAGKVNEYFGPPAPIGSKQTVVRGPGESANPTGLLRRFSSKKGGK